MSKRGSVFDWHTAEYDHLFKGDKMKSHGHAPTRILEGDHNGGWSLYIGSRYDVKHDAEGFDMIVNLSGGSIFMDHIRHIVPSHFAKVAKYSEPESPHSSAADREIILDWPNYGVPRLQFQFWVDLYEQMKMTKRTLLFCLGGHGRTGTATCLLMLASAAHTDGEKAIAWLRSHYCLKVVEGSQQHDLVLRFAKWLAKREVPSNGKG